MAQPEIVPLAPCPKIGSLENVAVIESQEDAPQTLRFLLDASCFKSFSTDLVVTTAPKFERGWSLLFPNKAQRIVISSNVDVESKKPSAQMLVETVQDQDKLTMQVRDEAAQDKKNTNKKQLLAEMTSMIHTSLVIDNVSEQHPVIRYMIASGRHISMQVVAVSPMLSKKIAFNFEWILVPVWKRWGGKRHILDWVCTNLGPGGMDETSLQHKRVFRDRVYEYLLHCKAHKYWLCVRARVRPGPLFYYLPSNSEPCENQHAARFEHVRIRVQREFDAKRRQLQDSIPISSIEQEALVVWQELKQCLFCGRCGWYADLEMKTAPKFRACISLYKCALARLLEREVDKAGLTDQDERKQVQVEWLAERKQVQVEWLAERYKLFALPASSKPKQELM